MSKKQQASPGQKKALIICSSLPDKQGVGMQQRFYRNLNLLTEQFAVDVIVMMKKQPLTPLSELRYENIYWLEDSYVDLPPLLSRIPGVFLIWRYLLLRTQGLRARYRQNYISSVKTVCNNQYDLVLFCRLRTVWFWQTLVNNGLVKPGHLAIDFDDIESKAIFRSLEFNRQSRGYQRYLLTYLESSLAKSREKYALREFDSVWVCSKEDNLELKQQKDVRSSVLTFPNTLYLPPLLPANSGSSSILFVGGMSYFPNVDAAGYFSNEILPLIIENTAAPVEFTIAGKTPKAEILALNDRDGIVVTGEVDSVKPFYASAHIVVAPIRFGGGTRIKILEAMAYGRLVITTKIGCEGLGVIHNEHVIIADTAAEFARCCNHYLNDADARKPIIDRARHFVEQNYSFECARNIFQRHYLSSEAALKATVSNNLAATNLP